MHKIISLFLLAILAVPLFAQKADKSNLEARRKQLNDLLAEQWEYTLQTSPEFATIIGDKRFNDKLSDFSQKQIDRDLAKSKEFFDKFSAVDTAGFPEQEQLNKTLMVRNLKDQLDTAKFHEWEMPVNQMGGVHLDMPQLVALFPFDTVKDYEDYVARLKALPRLMDENVIQMRKGMAEGLMPPKFLLEKVVTQAEDIGGKKPEESAFATPLQKFPAAISADDQKRLKQEVLDAIQNSVNPAYAKFAAFVKNEYAPKGRKDPGLWPLPNGDERYASAARRSTTTNMTPEEIHQLGLKQVAEIEGRMMDIAKKLGYTDLKKLNADIEKDPKLHGQSRKQILDEYQHYEDQMWARLPELFGRLPK